MRTLRFARALVDADRAAANGALAKRLCLARWSRLLYRRNSRSAAATRLRVLRSGRRRVVADCASARGPLADRVCRVYVEKARARSPKLCRYDREPTQFVGRGMIVCVAGTDRWNCMDTVEAYEPTNDAWRPLPRLSAPRRGCAVVVARDALHVIGGHDGTQSLTTVEILESPSGTWRAGPPLSVARANTRAIVTASNAIYAIGGFTGSNFLASLEILECGKRASFRAIELLNTIVVLL